MKKLSIGKKYRGPAASSLSSALVLALLLPSPAVGNDLSGETAPFPASFPYTLVGIARFDGISYASLIDPQTGHHFLLTTHQPSELDVTLAGVHTQDDSSGPAAIVQKNGVSVLLGLEAGPMVLRGEAPSPRPAPNLPQPGSKDGRELKPPPGATLPVVFQEVDPKKMTLTDDQKATLARLRQDFINAVQKTAPAPTTAPPPVTNLAASTSADDPLQQWETAQEQSDDRFRMLFGTQAFLAYQESSSYPTAP